MADIVSLSALGLVFLMGLRHGLDPDHVAVIDNLTFRAADERPRLAPWAGTLFAVGHSLSVGVVALGVALVAGRFTPPAWLTGAVDWAVIALLLLVGVANLRALLAARDYTPVGWRAGLVPRTLRRTSHPLGIVLIGAIFGLVFDTATQAAAWGSIAASGGGVAAAALVATAFAAGMILTDTADSHIVARLLRGGGDAARVRRYRRGVGWVIVALSFGMAGYSLAVRALPAIELADLGFSLLGAAMAGGVIASLAATRHAHAGRWRRS